MNLDRVGEKVSNLHSSMRGLYYQVEMHISDELSFPVSAAALCDIVDPAFWDTIVPLPCVRCRPRTYFLTRIHYMLMLISVIIPYPT